MSEKRDVDDVIKQLFKEHYPEADQELGRGLTERRQERYMKALAMYDAFKKGYLLGYRDPYKNEQQRTQP